MNFKITHSIPEIPKSIIIQSYIKGVASRRNFCKEEDARLSALVQQYGTKNWDLIASMMPLRNARQCRDRFQNYLAPTINLKPWTLEEDLLLISKYNELGSKWVQISQFFKGRSDNNLKNRWYTHLKKKIEGNEIYYDQKTFENHERIPLPSEIDQSFFFNEIIDMDMDQFLNIDTNIEL